MLPVMNHSSMSQPQSWLMRRISLRSLPMIIGSLVLSRWASSSRSMVRIMMKFTYLLMVVSLCGRWMVVSLVWFLLAIVYRDWAIFRLIPILAGWTWVPIVRLLMVIRMVNSMSSSRMLLLLQPMVVAKQLLSVSTWLFALTEV